MLIGHQRQWIFLTQALKLGKIPNGLIFSGPEKIGKRTLAVEFSMLIHCESENKPCGTCGNCQNIRAKSHPDVFFVEPLEKEIQISQIRDLAWRLSMRSYSGTARVAIIDKAHSMNSEAQSALLKTLEEPRGDAIIILVTEYPEMLFQTILSRCQRIRFYPVAKTEIKDFLKRQGIAEKRILEIAALSMGKPGRVVDFISNPQKITDYQKAVEDLRVVSKSDLYRRFELAKVMSEDSENTREILDIWLGIFREMLIARFVKDGNPDPNYSLLRMKNILEAIQNTNSLISSTNVSRRLALEVLMIEI